MYTSAAKTDCPKTGAKQMNKHQFDTEFSALSAKLASILAWYPIALKAMKNADRGEQLTTAISNYENLIDEEMQIRQKIGVLHTDYLNYLDSIIDGANKRAAQKQEQSK
jgi:hypothetical protein